MISFRLLSRFWAVSFVATGVCFALAPEFVAALLNGQAEWLGLTPGIPTGRDSLWFTLALSLMATISYLAWEAGSEDAPVVPYRALILSKLVSTVGFATFAIGVAGGWWLCAFTDGFIAVTLIVARRIDSTVTT